MSRWLALTLALVLGTVTAARALTPTWQWDGFLTYDDNPFHYSRSDLDTFHMNLVPARFPIRTSDDLEASIGTALTCRYLLFGLPATAEADVKLHTYFSNWEKSYGVATVGASQELWRGARGRLTYTAMPDYLLRYFLDPSTPEVGDYTACRFTEHLGMVELRQQFGAVTVQPEYGFEYDDYQPVFNHYDTKLHRLGGQASVQLAPNFTIRGEYEYRLASARGPVPDASYEQHRVGLSVMTRPRRLSRFGLDAGYWFAQRRYTTSNPGTIDPGHAGRVDYIEDARVTFRYRLTDMTLVVDYEMEWRSVESAFSTDIVDIKDYQESRLGLGLSYSPAKTRTRRQ